MIIVNIIAFVIAWFIAVTAMSCFSAIWSYVAKVEFREHILLTKILVKSQIHKSNKKYNWILGWVLHITVGAIFLGLYELLWMFTGFNRTVLWSLVFGTILGFLGITGWIIVFKFLQSPPKLNYLHFYIHLYFAHLVFSVVAFLVYTSYQL